MQSRPTRFVYSPLLNPLTDIRLVILDPGAEDDEIKCRIIHGNLSRIWDYEALSYAWGDPTITLPIILDGKPFEVTQNLESALRNLRDSGTNRPQGRILWIDAICIDQKNIEERNSQVQRMRSIYQCATRVVVWLGKCHEPEDDLVKFNPSVWGFERLAGDFSGLTLGAFELVESLHEDCSMTPSMHLGQLLCIAKRTWFNRLWVVQEVGVAKKTLVLCGRRTTTWESMVFAARMIAYLFASSVRDGTDSSKLLLQLDMNSVLSTAVDDADPTNLLCVLRETSGFEVSDQRDKLFAVTGITKSDELEDIKIDYLEAANVSSVYRAWAANRIQRKKNLDVFSACEDSGKPRSMEGNIHSSWVPDLRYRWASDCNLFYLTHRYRRAARNRLYTASGQSCSNPSISLDGLEISLTGVFLDSIARLGRSGGAEDLVVDNITPQMMAIVESWEKICSEFFQTTFTHDPPLYAKFLDVLFRGYDYCNETTDISLRTRYCEWRCHNDQQPGVKDDSTQELWRGPFCNSIELVLWTMVLSCQFFITEKGYLGMIGSRCNAEIGDRVYVLHGGATPFLLRQKDNESSQRDFYRLMGPCYLNGYMYGEASKEDNSSVEITIV